MRKHIGLARDLSRPRPLLASLCSKLARHAPQLPASTFTIRKILLGSKRLKP
ncbi:hypothetical protein SAMCFNEI73_Ch3392 [Sinorhizobium americanum]|uniref:Uncharacterized protein n=1 Tax=Sinorhizobium americanum TaxID=194963 RepID=A0A1L3LRC2_9HYPH|nr:hypothetical protein SAMCCGM7_Ch3269 [Sinorhizobium americanum CCGM7]APG92648.1 hypothetical protein SAMCFNEI73_Ch3392 [Sinorhizobium americanum]